jgi:hypothetical protein
MFLTPIKTDKIEFDFDTIIVCSSVESFSNYLIKENRWFPLRLDDKKIPYIKWIAIYQSSPICALTHYSEIASIKTYEEDESRYQINIGKLRQIKTKLRIGKQAKFRMQGIRYSTLSRILSVKNLEDLLF